MEPEDRDWKKDRELAEFERGLRQAMRRRDAPVGLKTRVLARAGERRRLQHSRWWMLQRVAASAVLAVVCGGYAVYHEREVHRQAEEERRGEAAREQVLTALRITNRTLNRVSTRLTAESE